NNNNNNNSNNNTLRNEEISFFNTLSKDWWNPEGTMKPLHRMNPFRVKYIIDRLKNSNEIVKNNSIQEPLKGLNVIDVGCGAGLLCESLSRLGADTVIGLDAAGNSVKMAISHASLDSKLDENLNNNKLKYIESTIENFLNLEESKNGFDLVCSLEVIEHVDNPKQFVELLTKVLKPGGSIFISTINKTNLSYLTTILGAEYLLKLVPVGTHHWEQYVTPNELTQQLSFNNCEIVDVQGLFYNPISFEWSFSANKSVNYIVHAIKK
ncbi:hypothetical protein DICPUDRAFT_10678, partial [Dictyostelium purpureum]